MEAKLGTKENLGLFENIPEEVIEHILCFVDGKNRIEAALVCSDFYELICRIGQPLKLGYIKIWDEDTFNSIMSSDRRFKELRIYNDLIDNPSETSIRNPRISKISMIIEKLGFRLKKLELFYFKMSEDELMEILKCVPNLRELDCSYNSITPSSEAPEVAILRKLKKFIFDINVSPKILGLVPADTLREVKFVGKFRKELPNNLSEKDFISFLANQTKIKKMTFADSPNISLPFLQLEELVIKHVEKDELIESLNLLLNSQSKIRSLYLRAEKVNEETFAAIGRMKQLEVLELNIGLLTSPKFNYMATLKNLKKLSLKSYLVVKDALSSLISIAGNVPELESLSIFANMHDQIIDFSNFGKLRNLKLFTKYGDDIGALLKALPNLVTLAVEASDPIGAVTNIDVVHTNLKEFDISYRPCRLGTLKTTLLKILEACPNLEKFKSCSTYGTVFSYVQQCEDLNFTIEKPLIWCTNIIEENLLQLNSDLIDVFKSHRNLQQVEFDNIKEVSNAKEISKFHNNWREFNKTLRLRRDSEWKPEIFMT